MMADFKFKKTRPRLIKQNPRLKSNFYKSSDGEYISLGVELGDEDIDVVSNGFSVELTRHFPGSFDDEYVHNVYRIDVWLLSTLLLNADHFGKEMHEVLFI